MLESKLGRYDVKLHETEHFEMEAKLAVSMIERWGMVCCLADGEDSSGRAKPRLLTPDELVNRAFTTAKIVMKVARKHKLIHVCPSITELKDVV